MMYAELYQYLIHYKQLSVPGIGTFLLTRNPAETDFPNRKINPPSYSFTHLFPATPASNGFFYWLGNALNISDREAVIRFNDFSFDMRKQIIHGNTIEWKGVGVLTKGLGGEIKFSGAGKDWMSEKPVPAEKVIREKAEHMVRVGEDEKTSAEMVEILGQQGKQPASWWVWALSAGFLAVMFAGWHFSKNGITLSSTANNARNIPQEAGATYKTLP